MPALFNGMISIILKSFPNPAIPAVICGVSVSASGNIYRCVNLASFVTPNLLHSRLNAPAFIMALPGSKSTVSLSGYPETGRHGPESPVLSGNIASAPSISSSVNTNCLPDSHA